MRWHSPDVLESADQPGHEPSALTKVSCAARPGPRVSQPPGQPERHWSANHVHAALSRPAGPARKQAAAKGRPVVSVPEGSRPRAGQVTPACPWAGAANAQACRHDPTCRSARVPRRCECSDSLPGRLSLQLGRYLFRYRRSAGAHPSCIADNNSRVVRWSVCADHERALSQICVKSAARSVGELSGRSECRVRTGAICLVGEAVEKVTSHENAIHIECRVRL